MSITVTIGICTFRRAHIAATLASIAALEAPLDCALRIIVADNDDEPTAQVTVHSAATAHSLDVTYQHAPAHNISIARNACLDAASGDYFAFIDDDEVVTPGWLTAMLARMQETNAPILLGPVFAVYADGTPRWLRAGDFHSTYATANDGVITTGYAGNVFMRRSAIGDLRFKEELGITGGEDTDFFARAYVVGNAIHYAPEALVFEGVPPERATLHWLMKRRLRYGHTHGQLLRTDKKPRLWHLCFATAKMLTSYAMMVICGLSPLGRRRWLLRATLHRGVIQELTH